MKKLLIVCVCALVLGLVSSPAFAAHLSTIVSDIFPSPGETIEVEIWVREMAGTEIKTFDFCLKYDSTIFEVDSMQINDTSVGGCVAAAFSITNDNGTDCIRLGGAIFPGTTCTMVGHEYVLATVVFYVEDTWSTDLCTSVDCQSGDGCGHDFGGYIEDETGEQYPTESCRALNYP